MRDVAPGICLGTIVTTGPECEPDLPMSALMFLRGTLAEQFEPAAGTSYVMPLLDAGLRAALLAAFAPQPGDHPLMEAAPVDDLAAFLDAYPGARLLTHSRTEAVTVLFDPDAVRGA